MKVQTVFLPDNHVQDSRIWADKVEQRQYGDADPDLVARGIDIVETQFRAKLVECAVADYLGVPPRFGAEGSDGNVDLEVPIWGQWMTVDVKSSSPGAFMLVWPRTKSLSKCADILAFGIAYPEDHQQFGAVDLYGWITKNQFLKLHRRATPEHRLADNTPYMHLNELTPMPFLAAAVCGSVE